MLDTYSIILYPILFVFPAYVANAAPVILGGGKAIDGGMKIGGMPVFGKNKTIRGLIGGIAAGVVVSYAESAYLPFMLASGIALTLGTHAGDLLGSFIKRRAGNKPGSEVIFLDQYLFLVMALIFAAPLGNLPSVYGLVFIFVITGVLHRLTNIAAHAAGLKNAPW
jgi:CDP-2,3-bis-(O-geranylgeranyl)-sn-glycerol synthase